MKADTEKSVAELLRLVAVIDPVDLRFALARLDAEPLKQLHESLVLLHLQRRKINRKLEAA